MASDAQILPARATNPGTSTLLTEILHDVEDLLKQQMALFKHEVKVEVQRIATAIIVLIVGATTALIGIGSLSLMLAYLLNWTIPALPLWACFGLVGIAIVGLGVASARYGLNRIRNLKLLPEESMAALRENLEWTRKPN